MTENGVGRPCGFKCLKELSVSGHEYFQDNSGRQALGRYFQRRGASSRVQLMNQPPLTLMVWPVM